MAKLQLWPITFDQACEYVRLHHRHHIPPRGWKFGTSVWDGEKVVGVVMVGRPVARAFDNGWTLEVIRLCTIGTPHVASMLYAAAWRACRALGYTRLITYTLASESGVSVKAAGWKAIGLTEGGSWDTPTRRRVDKAPIERKTLWEMK